MPLGEIIIPEGYWEQLSSTVDTEKQLIIAQVEHFSSFSMGTATVVGTQTDLSHTYQGTLNIPILDLTITNTDPVVDDTLDYIGIFSNCTDDSDITSISLWNDTDDNAVINAADTQIGVTQVLVAGETNFTGISEIILADTTLNVLVALDVNATAKIGNYLDLLIPANEIGLANAGLNIEAIDPAGNVTIVQELTDPHAVYGVISNVIGNVSYAWVNLTNNRTGAVENIMTDDQGRYEVNLGFMYEGFQNNDTIFIVANDSFTQTGWNTTVVNVSQFGERCDIYLGKGPVASNETPANNTTISNLVQNVTVNITAGIFSVNGT